MSTEQKKTASEAILDAIKGGRIVMRPRWHFILRAALAALGVLLALCAAAYIASFILFALRLSGLWFLPAFGFRGFWILLIRLPHLLILLALVFIVLLELLVRKYPFAYRQPLLYTALGVIAVALAGSFLFAKISFHERFYRHVHTGDLPFYAGPAEQFYRFFGEARWPDMHRGAIESIAGSRIVMRDRFGTTFTIAITPGTRLANGVHFSVGDEIIVLGEEAGGEGSTVLNAQGIEKLQ